jgi:cation transport ATPase
MVAGMTCTGCLKILEGIYDSIPTISNVKTSLLFSQAVFDLQQTHKLNKDNISYAIAKKTGSACPLVHHVGEELDLIPHPTIPSLGDKWPSGVVNITSTGKSKIRVSCHAQNTGARDLLSLPFFQHASLAPPTTPLSFACGRASVCRSLYLTLLSTILTIPILIFSCAPLPSHELLYGGMSCGLATLVQIFIVGPFYVKAFRVLFFSRLVEMDMLVVLSTTAAYVYSVLAYSFLVLGKPLSTREFCEISTLLVTLIIVAKTDAEYARQKAIELISMESLQNPSAILVGAGRDERVIDARLLQYNDTFKVLPEMSVVTDRMIQEGGRRSMNR